MAIEQHLTRFVEDMMTQKFRLDLSKKEYEALHQKVKERIIDQTNLINGMKDSESEKFFIDRKEADILTQKEVEDILSQKEEIIEKMTLDIYHHMLELSNIELSRSGFVTHIIAKEEHVDFDKESKVLTFEKPGRAEVPVATVLRRWTDASQITIIPTENKQQGESQ